MDMNLNKLQEIVKHRETWCVAVCGAAKSQTWLNSDKWNPTVFAFLCLAYFI